MEIGERIFSVHEPQLDPVADVREERRHWPGHLRLLRRRLRLPHGEALAGCNAFPGAHAPVRPLDRHRFDRIELTQPEGEDIVHARLESARGHQLLEERVGSAPERDLGPDRESVGALSLELHLQIAGVRQRARVVAIDRGFLVDVVHHEVQRPVAVQVAIRGTIGESRRIQSPGRASVREGQITPIPERVVRQLRRAHDLDESHEVDPLPFGRGHHRLISGQKRDVALRGHVPQDAVRDVDILVTVQIVVRDQRAPAPVRPRHAGHLADLAERPVAVVQLEHVAHELVVIVVLQLGLVGIPCVERGRHLEPVLVLRQHVEHVDVGPAVVVDVRGVEPHRREADGRHLRLERLGERSVAIVDVEVIPLEEVVRDVDVRPAVAIQVAHGHTQTEGDFAAEDAGLLAHIEKAPVDIAIQLVPAERVAHGADVAQPEAADGPRRVVHEVQVQPSVAVVIEERGVGGVARVVDAIRGRLFGEGGHPIPVQALVDVQLVGAALAADIAGVAHVDVQQAVAVDVGEGDPGSPEPLTGHTGLPGHISKPVRAQVQVQPVVVQVRREEELRQPVAGEVAERDAAAVVVVAVGEDVQLGGVDQAVLEAHAGVLRGEPGEEPVAYRGRLTREAVPVGAAPVGAAREEHNT